jgi:hypothetical protein
VVTCHFAVVTRRRHATSLCFLTINVVLRFASKKSHEVDRKNLRSLVMATVRAHDGDGDVDFDVAESAEAELVAVRWYCYLHATCTALRTLRAAPIISSSGTVLSMPNFYNT